MLYDQTFDVYNHPGISKTVVCGSKSRLEILNIMINVICGNKVIDEIYGDVSVHVSVENLVI